MAKEHTQEIRVRDQKVLVANIIKYTILIIGAFTMIFPLYLDAHHVAQDAG